MTESGAAGPQGHQPRVRKIADLPEDPTYGSTVWLEPYWEDWARGGSSWHSIDESAAARPYQHWHLAAELAREGADDVRLGTAIQKLWNAVESRTRLLHSEYRLADLRRVMGWSRDRPDTLEMLARIGLARPLVLRELKDIRNAVEHADRGAPPLSQCLRFVDSVWYFLRSTDIFAVRRVTSFDLEGDGPNPGAGSGQSEWLEIDFSEGGWLPRMRGWFSRGNVHAHEIAGAIPLQLDTPARTAESGRVHLRGRASSATAGVRQAIRDYFFVDLPDNGRDGPRAIGQR